VAAAVTEVNGQKEKVDKVAGRDWFPRLLYLNDRNEKTAIFDTWVMGVP
jgi:hypothetical protein